MPVLSLRTPLAITALLATSLVAAPASATTDPGPTGQTRSGEVETLTITAADLVGSATSVAFAVPECATEIAFVMSGGEGGSAGAEDTAGFARGGLGTVLSGTLSGLQGTSLALFPATAGASVDSANAPGAEALGGSGYRSGGAGGSTSQQGDAIFDAGGGGGGASAIQGSVDAATIALAIAAGGGGAGGQASADVENTGFGGTNGGDGGRGANTGGSGGVGGFRENGHGGAGGASGAAQGGAAGGGGGAGLLGGGSGTTVGGTTRGGGGGGSGASVIDAALAGEGNIADYGLSESDAQGAGDGVIILAWYSCPTEFTVSGTTTSVDGTVAPATGWSQSIAASGVATPDTGVLDAEGAFTILIDDFAEDTRTVTVTQEERDGWLMQNWTSPNLNVPLAVCTVDGDAEQTLTVTNLSASSYSVAVPRQSDVTCASNTVEAAPEMRVIATSRDETTGGYYPAAVNSGDEMEFAYSIFNDGNIPLALTATDSGVLELVCPRTELAPNSSTTCKGKTIVTRD